jgi:hypothetical protein
MQIRRLRTRQARSNLEKGFLRICGRPGLDDGPGNDLLSRCCRRNGDDLCFEFTAALTDHAPQGVRDDGKSWTQVFQKSGVTFHSVVSSQSQGAWDVRCDRYARNGRPTSRGPAML